MKHELVKRVATLTVIVLVVQVLLVIPYIIFSGSRVGNVVLAGAALLIPIVVSLIMIRALRRRRRERARFQNPGARR